MKPREILEKEELCIEEHAPFCMAECPVHFDVRNMNILIEKDDFKGAYELYKKAVLFPDVVSAKCDSPCRKKCKRSEAGDSIAIGELERFITRYGKHKIEIKKSDIKMSKKIAIVECGLDSKAIIYTLLCKGYRLDLFTSKKEIPIESDDFDFLNDEGLIIHVNKDIGKSLFAGLAESHDAIYFSGFTKDDFDASFTELSSSPKHFFSINSESVIQKISHGKQMSISIDRFLKGVSMTALLFTVG